MVSSAVVHSCWIWADWPACTAIPAVFLPSFPTARQLVRFVSRTQIVPHPVRANVPCRRGQLSTRKRRHFCLLERCVEKTRLVLLAGGLTSNEQNGQVWIGDTELTGKYALQRMLKGVF